MKKKLLIGLIVMPMLMLTACGNSTKNTEDADVYETHIYCTYTGYNEPGPCLHCEKWSEVKDEDLRTAASITCTQFVNGSGGSSHCHYIVTWINRK